jgi:hypothetical protein
MNKQVATERFVGKKFLYRLFEYGVKYQAFDPREGENTYHTAQLLLELTHAIDCFGIMAIEMDEFKRLKRNWERRKGTRSLIVGAYVDQKTKLVVGVAQWHMNYGNRSVISLREFVSLYGGLDHNTINVGEEPTYPRPGDVWVDKDTKIRVWDCEQWREL